MNDVVVDRYLDSPDGSQINNVIRSVRDWKLQLHFVVHFSRFLSGRRWPRELYDILLFSFETKAYLLGSSGVKKF